MHTSREAILGRAARLLERFVEPAVYPDRCTVQLAVFHVLGEPVDPSVGLQAAYEPFQVGQPWGPRWGTAWFKVTATVPQRWHGRSVVLLVDLGGPVVQGYTAEGLVWRDGRPVAGISTAHPDVVLTRKAVGGETIELFIEAAANPRLGPGLRSPLAEPDPGGRPMYRLRTMELRLFDEDVYRAVVPLRYCHLVATELPAEDPRAQQLVHGIAKACDLIDPQAVATTAPKAVAELLDSLPSGGGTLHTITAIGQSHVDIAWLWPLREGRRKYARTLSTALALMEEYPQYRFASSQALLLEWMRESYPAIFEQVRDRVAEGRLEPVGGMWVEPDCELISGESLVRQLLYGQRFFREQFDYDCRNAWLPDLYGGPGNLPQILRKAGIEHFLTAKFHRNESVQFPHSSFHWEGIDGSRVLTHFPPSATSFGNMSPRDLLRSQRQFLDHGPSDRAAYLYGHGDGGGGPTRVMIDEAAVAGRVLGTISLELGSVDDFFATLAADQGDLAVWRGEIYGDMHRGVYTTHDELKAAHRRAEVGLLQAETFAALAPGDAVQPDLDTAWRVLLECQFHDILDGVSIRRVTREAVEALTGVADLVGDYLTGCLNALAAKTRGVDGQVVVVANPHAIPREEVVRLPGDGVSVRDADGNTSAFQPSQAEPGQGFARIRVPSCGHQTVEILTTPSPSDAPAVNLDLDNRTIENGLISVQWNEHGLITAIRDLECDRELIPMGGLGNVLEVHEDYPNHHDAWDVDEHHLRRGQAWSELATCEAVEVGPVRGAVRFGRSAGESSVTQTMVLDAGSRLISFDTVVDWRHEHRLLTTSFPTTIRSHQVASGTHFGHVWRATHSNTLADHVEFENCAQSWFDLSEPSFGLTVLTGHKYGHRVDGSTVRLSLLRSPRNPDPLTDLGRHHFRYALLPHLGDLQRGAGIEYAEAFDFPLQVTVATGDQQDVPLSSSLLSVDHPGVVVTAVKPGTGGSVIVRLHEAWGDHRQVTLSCEFPVTTVTETDLLEQSIGRLDHSQRTICLDFGPFEVRTLRLQS